MIQTHKSPSADLELSSVKSHAEKISPPAAQVSVAPLAVASASIAPLPWLRQLFSFASASYYLRSILWVLILLCLTSAIPLAGVADFTSLRSIIIFAVLIAVLVFLKLFFIDSYIAVCWFCIPGNVFLKSWISFMFYVYLVKLPIILEPIAPLQIFSWVMQCFFGSIIDLLMAATLTSGVLMVYKSVKSLVCKDEDPAEPIRISTLMGNSSDEIRVMNNPLNDGSAKMTNIGGRLTSIDGSGKSFSRQTMSRKSTFYTERFTISNLMIMDEINVPLDASRISFLPRPTHPAYLIQAFDKPASPINIIERQSMRLSRISDIGISIPPATDEENMVDPAAVSTLSRVPSDAFFRKTQTADPRIPRISYAMQEFDHSSSLQQQPQVVEQKEASAEGDYAGGNNWLVQYFHGTSFIEHFNARASELFSFVVDIPSNTYKELVATKYAYSLPCEKPFIPTMKDMFNFWAALSVLFAIAAFSSKVPNRSGLIGFEISTSVAVFLLSTCHRLTLIGSFPKPLQLLLQPVLIFAFFEILIIALSGGTAWSSFLSEYIVRSSSDNSIFALSLNGGGDFIAVLLPAAIIVFGFDTVDSLIEYCLLLPVLLPLIFLLCFFILALNISIAKGVQSPMDIKLPMITRTVTTPIAIQIASVTGASPALTAGSTILNGIVIYQIGPYVLNLCRFRDPISRGVACALSGTLLGVVALTENKETVAAGLGMLAFGVCTMFYAIIMIIDPIESFIVNI